jgi:uncharacterized protein (DUF1778 family)
MAEHARKDQADRRDFLLSESEWLAFCEILDRPERQIPELERLLRQPSILERELSSSD